MVTIENQVKIQKRIDEVMREEFDKMIEECSDDPLIRLLRENRLEELSLDEIKLYLIGGKDA